MANSVEGSKIPVVGLDVVCKNGSSGGATLAWVVTDASFDGTPPVIELTAQDGSTGGRIAYNTAFSPKLTLDVVIYGTDESTAGTANGSGPTTFQVINLSSASKHQHFAASGTGTDWTIQSRSAKSSNTGMQTWSLTLAPKLA